MGTGKVTRQKQTLSTKVIVSTKERIDKEAAEKGISTSEHLSNILEKYEEQKEEIEFLKNELHEKNKQLSRTQTTLENIQISLDDSLKLQQQAENRNRQLSDEHRKAVEERQMLIEEKTETKKMSIIERFRNWRS